MFAEVRYDGRKASDPVATQNGAAAFTSSVKLTGNYDPNFGNQRWGDYSRIAIDPYGATTAWLVNEDVVDANHWGTRIARVSLP